MTKQTMELVKERAQQKLIYLQRTGKALSKLYSPLYRLYGYLNVERHYKMSFGFPSYLFIELTNNCNLKCSFCPRGKSDKALGVMGFPLFKKVIDECAGHKKLCELYLHKDGDPLLAPELPEMIAYAKERGIADKIAIASNGILLNEKMSEKLLRSGLDELTISIDAATGETYAKIKGVAAFDLVERNTRRFIEMRNQLGLKRPMVKVKIIYMKENQKEVDAFIRKWESIADSVPVREHITWAGSVEDRNVRMVKFQNDIHPCVAPFTNLAVNWDGDVSVCCVDWNKKLIVGDIKKETLYDVWHGKKLKELRLRHLRGELDGLQCKVCDFRVTQSNMNPWVRRKCLIKTLSM